MPELSKATKKDKYVTVTLFQLEKIYGTSPEAQAFVKDLVKGVSEEFVSVLLLQSFPLTH